MKQKIPDFSGIEVYERAKLEEKLTAYRGKLGEVGYLHVDYYPRTAEYYMDKVISNAAGEVKRVGWYLHLRDSFIGNPSVDEEKLIYESLTAIEEDFGIILSH